MATPGKGTKKDKKKPIPVKTSFNNPYNLKWMPLEKGHARFILRTVKEKIDKLGFKKRRGSGVRKWKKKTDKEPASAPGDTVESVQRGEPTTESRSWTNKDVRKQLAIGINEVTKCLERNELSLVLVCSSVKPAHMISHLIPLCKTRSVPACQVPDLSENISGSLGLFSVLALGFKRGADEFVDTVDAIVPKVPSIDVAWVPTERNSELENVRTGDSHLLSPPSEGGEQQSSDSHADPANERKRKLELSTEAAGGLEVLLQPLKVKKIIPNPSKIRNPKRKKMKRK